MFGVSEMGEIMDQSTKGENYKTLECLGGKYNLGAHNQKVFNNHLKRKISTRCLLLIKVDRFTKGGPGNKGNLN